MLSRLVHALISFTCVTVFHALFSIYITCIYITVPLPYLPRLDKCKPIVNVIEAYEQ